MQVNDKNNEIAHDNKDSTSNQNVKTFDVIIIGSGPAGYTAATYSSRAKLKTLIITGSLPGGQLMTTSEVENYPGFPNGIFGPELMMNMRQQAERFGSFIVDDEVIEVDFKKKPFFVKTYSTEYVSKAILICTGATPRKLGIVGEDEFGGRGVSYCATCDGPFFKGEEIAVVGGGDTALEEATFLTKFGRSVKLIHRRNSLKASKILQEKSFENPKIHFMWDSTITKIKGNKKISTISVKNVNTREEQEINVGGLFIAIGHEPNTKIFKNQLEMDDHGYIILKENSRTSVEGVFAAGDVHDFRYRQAVTAAGYGCMAALDVEKWLTENQTDNNKL
ncbi:MAG TPA: thioredoxin-disulfide reductase [Nitrososphaeraceae archaeon]|nr:thioredoxin-disulfide reductase [Nitrososphaeraceae archaeon]